MQIWFNGESREARDGITVAELLRELELSPRRVAVEVNQEIVPRGQHDARQLAAGDCLEIVTLVGGG